MSFSPDGKLLASIGADDDHSIGIYDWDNSILRSNTLGEKGQVLDCCWKSSSVFVQCGSKHIKFWTIQGANISGKKGLFGSQSIDAILCVAPYNKDDKSKDSKDNDLVLAGGQDGKIYVFKDNNLVANVGKEPIHAGGVTCIHVVKRGLILTAGKDGKVLKWTSDDPTFTDKSTVSRYFVQ